MGFLENNSPDAVLCIMKVGEVTSLDCEHCRVRATFDDEDGKTSYWLPVLQRKTLEDKDYSMPDLGEDVLCVFFNEGEEDGFVLGSFYADEVTPPENSEDKRCVKFKDGTLISYDRASHELITQIGSTRIFANQEKIRIEAPDSIDCSAGKNTDIVSGSETNISGGSAVNIKAPVLTLTMGSTKMTLSSGAASIETDNLVFRGNMTVTGNLSVKGDIDGTGNISAGGRVSGSNI